MRSQWRLKQERIEVGRRQGGRRGKIREPGDKPDNMPQADQSGVAQRKKGESSHEGIIVWRG